MLIGHHGTLLQGSQLERVFPGGQPITQANAPGDLAQSVRSAFAPVLKAERIPFGSFKLAPAAESTGWAGADVQGLANYLKDLGPVWLTVWHEWENDMPPADFFRIYRFVRPLIKSIAPNVQFGPVSMAYQWVAGRAIADPAAAMLPTEEVDFYGIDTYSHTPLDKGGSLAAHPGFQRWLNVVPDKSKIFVVERGFDVTDAQQVELLNQDYKYLKSLNAKGMAYWNANTNGHLYVLGPNAQAAYNSIAVDAATVPTPPVPPADPLVYTQAQYVQAVAAAGTQGLKTGANQAYADVAAYASAKASPLS